jgi:hypothetical protein
VSVWFILPTTAVTAECEQRQGQATVRIRAAKVEAGQVETRLSDPLLVILSVEGQASLEVEPVRTLTPSPNWQVSRRWPTEQVPLPSGRVRWQQTFQLDPLKPGDVPLTLTPLRFREGAEGDRWQMAAWQPILVRVITEVINPDLTELRDITPPEEVPTAPSWPISPYWLVVALFLLAVAGGGWRLWRRSTRPPAILRPDQWALRELQRIPSPSSPTQSEVDGYYTRLSGIVRRYLELRFHLPALEQTTAEFLEGIRLAPQLTEEQQERLRDLMERCDLVKFARVTPTVQECWSIGAMARELIEQTAHEPREKAEAPEA